MRGAALLALLATVGCAPARNEVLVEIVSDGPPQSLRAVSVVTRMDDRVVDIQSRPIGPDPLGAGWLNLPGTYAVYTDDGSRPDVSVEVGALTDSGRISITRRARFTLPRARTAFLRLGLVEACLSPAGDACIHGQSCAEGHCVDERVDPALLPDFRPELAGAPACTSSAFREAIGGAPLPVVGACPAGQYCREGLCYPGRAKARLTFAFAAMSRAVAAAGIAAGDFDEDGHLDVVALDTGGDRVALLAGTGDGNFGVRTAAASAVVAGAPLRVIVRDYDEDGHLDLALSYAERVGTLRGIGDGTFVAGATVAASTASGPLTSSDFDGDGHLDIAVAAGNRTALFLGTGDGSFRADGSWESRANVTALAAARLDRGNADWLVAALTEGADVFQAGMPLARLHLNVSAPEDVAAVDLAGDGFQDLVFAHQGLSVVPGQGDGALGEPQGYPSSASGIWIGGTRLATGDFDGDGVSDVARFEKLVDDNMAKPRIAVFVAGSRGALDLPVDIGWVTNSYDWVVGDFDGDGNLDVVTLATPPPDIAPGGLLFFRNTTARWPGE